MDKICIWAITPGGLQIGQKLLKSLPESDFFVSRTISDSFITPASAVMFERLPAMFEKQFRNYRAHICIFSTGIAVRMAAPLLESKLTDPAVVVLDDRAFHVISLVSGHLGGANALTLEVARITGADPVITTATDVNRVPSIDMVAKEQHLLIENPKMIKRVNMEFLQKRRVRLIDPLNLVAPYIPEQFLLNEPYQEAGEGELHSSSDLVTVVCSDLENCGKRGWVDSEMEIRDDSSTPDSEKYNLVPRETMILRPASLMVGMGCNRGTTEGELMELLISSFKEQNLCIRSIAGFATTSVKEDEQGLLDLAQRLGRPIAFYDRAALNSVETIENPSEMVEKHLGVKSVCEAAAILAAENGNLIVPKIKKGNATLAVARMAMKKSRESLI